jgi:hypothetical protein
VGKQDSGFIPGTANPFATSGMGIYAAGIGSWGGTFSAGNIYAERNVYAGSNVMLGDLAEYFKSEEPSTPGDLIAISEKSKDSYTLGSLENAAMVIGVHSAAPTMTLNAPEGTPVALTGRVPVKATASNGAIQIGDYLTASSQKGFAMKATGSCYIIGRALEALPDGSGKILVMVQPGWYNPTEAAAATAGGSFKLVKGKKEVTINDPSILPNSRVFVSFRGKVGCEHWVETIERGRFTVALDVAAQSDTPFDYFVDNAEAKSQLLSAKLAQLAKEEQAQLTEPQHQDIQMHAKAERTNTAAPLNPNEVHLPLRMADTQTLPPSPPDPNLPWVWEAGIGFLSGGNQNNSLPPTGSQQRDITLPTTPRR